MKLEIGLRELVLSTAISVGAAWLLGWPPPLGAALGVLVVPFVALATVFLPSEPEGTTESWEPTRGVCRCGHVMSMHCHADCSGPCAVPNCPCEGRD